MKKIIQIIIAILFVISFAEIAFAQVTNPGVGVGVDGDSGFGWGVGGDTSVGAGVGNTGILPENEGSGDLIGGSNSSGGALTGYISELYKYAQAIGFSLATLVVIYAGYLYATSAGNPEQINSAKEYLIGALAGYALLLMAVLIYNAINPNKGGGSTNQSGQETTPTTNQDIPEDIDLQFPDPEIQDFINDQPPV